MKKILLIILMILIPVSCIGCNDHKCNFGDWTVVIEATENSVGEERRYCETCSGYESREIPIIEYAYILTTSINDKETKIYIDETGEYVLEDPNVEGYSFLSWVDENGNEFQKNGTISESQKVYANLEILETTNFNDFKKRVESGAKEVYVNADFEITDTVYVYDQVSIYTTKDCVLTRNVNFDGDLFVIGQDSNNNNPLLKNKTSKLTIKPKNDSILKFEGNKTNITKTVKGTAFYITNSATLEMYDNVVITDFKKLGNERVVNEFNSLWENANRAGGAAVIVAYGTFNMYGGVISNNESNLVDEAVTEGLDETAYISNCGGAIYNRSSFNMYGGLIENNDSGRAGAVYNYLTFNMYGGNLKNNHATAYGGAIYLPNSQYTTLRIGKETTETVVVIEDNESDKSGGAIFAQTLTNFIIHGGTTFKNNKVIDGNGGAICSSGPLLAKDVEYIKNEAEGKGGALYLYYKHAENSVRFSEIKNSVFENNSAQYGAALTLYSSEEEYSQGAVVDVDNCMFKNNIVSSNGGAVYLARDSKLTLKNSTFEGNISNSTQYGGGAIYLTKSKGVFENIIFKSNKSTYNGGAIAIYSNSNIEATGLEFNENEATNRGGAVYSNKSKAILKNNKFNKNKAGDTGGAISTYSNTEMDLIDISADQNESGANGGFIYNSSSAITITKVNNANSIISLNKSGECGGAIAVHSEGSVNIYGLTFNNNEAVSDGGAIYVKGAKVILGDSQNVEENKFYQNKATSGGAIYVLASSSVTGELNAYNLNVNENVATDKGGALYFYTNALVNIENLTAIKNKIDEESEGDGYGGCAYISGKANITINNVNARENSANIGGFVYITTTATKLTLISGTITENVATSGSVLWSNSAGAIIAIKGGLNPTELIYDKDGIEGKNQTVNIIDTEEVV